MFNIHNRSLNYAERHRIEKLEIFDEFEEWELLQTHYWICIGSNFFDTSELSF